MNDFLGKPLVIGQEAVSIEPGCGSSGPSSWNFRRVRVLRFTPTLAQLCLSGAVEPADPAAYAKWLRWSTWKRSPHKIIGLPGVR